MSTAAPIPGNVAQRAVEWLVELQSDDASPHLLDEWRRWRAAHPDHERAWLRIESVNGRLRRLATPVNAAIAHATLTAPASPRRRRAIGTLAALVLAGGAAWMVHDGTRWREWTADHHTAVGERRRIALDDGTAVMLNSGSAIDVNYGPTERRVRLVAGEVFIVTAKDAGHRPFLVDTAAGEAQALGTRFTVRQYDAAVDVAVYEGAVQVRVRDGVDPPPIVRAGQHLHFGAGVAETTQPADELGMAWTDGFIVAKGMRLADFLAELNRHSPRALSCDPALADLRVSGSYPLADIDKVLDALAATLSLRVETTTRLFGFGSARVTLKPRTPQSD